MSLKNVGLDVNALNQQLKEIPEKSGNFFTFLPITRRMASMSRTAPTVPTSPAAAPPAAVRRVNHARDLSKKWSAADGGTLSVTGHAAADGKITLSLALVEITGLRNNWRSRHRAETLILEISEVTSSDGRVWFRLSDSYHHLVYGVEIRGENLSLLSANDERLLPYRDTRADRYIVQPPHLPRFNQPSVSRPGLGSILVSPPKAKQTPPAAAPDSARIESSPPQPQGEKNAPAIPEKSKITIRPGRSLLRSRPRQEAAPILPQEIKSRKETPTSRSVTIDIALTPEIQISGTIPVTGTKAQYSSAKITITFLGKEIQVTCKPDKENQRLRMQFALQLGETTRLQTEWLEKIIRLDGNVFTVDEEIRGRLDLLVKGMLDDERQRLIAMSRSQTAKTEDLALVLENTAFRVEGLGASAAGADQQIKNELRRLTELSAKAQAHIKNALSAIDALFNSSDNDWLERTEAQQAASKLEQAITLAQNQLGTMLESARFLYDNMTSDEDMEKYETMDEANKTQQSHIDKLLENQRRAQARLSIKRDFSSQWSTLENHIQTARATAEALTFFMNGLAPSIEKIERDANKKAEKLTHRTSAVAKKRISNGYEIDILRDPNKNIDLRGNKGIIVPGRAGNFFVEMHFTRQGAPYNLTLRADHKRNPDVLVLGGRDEQVALQTICDPKFPYAAFAATLPGEITPRQYFLFWIDREKMLAGTSKKTAVGFRRLTEKELPQKIKDQLYQQMWAFNNDSSTTAATTRLSFSHNNQHISIVVGRTLADHAATLRHGGRNESLEVWNYPLENTKDYFYSRELDKWFVFTIHARPCLAEISNNAVPPVVLFARKHGLSLADTAIRDVSPNSSRSLTSAFTKNGRLALEIKKFARQPSATDRQRTLALQSFPGMMDGIVFDALAYDENGECVGAVKLSASVDVSCIGFPAIIFAIPEERSCKNIYLLLSHAPDFDEHLVSVPREKLGQITDGLLAKNIWRGETNGNGRIFFCPDNPDERIELSFSDGKKSAKRLNQYSYQAHLIKGNERTLLEVFLHVLRLPDRDLLYLGDPAGERLWRLEARANLQNPQTLYDDVMFEMDPEIETPYTVRTYWADRLRQRDQLEAAERWQYGPPGTMATSMAFDNRPGDNAVHIAGPDAERSLISPQITDRLDTLELCHAATPLVEDARTDLAEIPCNEGTSLATPAVDMPPQPVTAATAMIPLPH